MNGRHDFELSWIERDLGRDPGLKIVCADRNLIRQSRGYTLRFEKSVLACDNGLSVMRIWPFEHNRRITHCIAIHIGNRADYSCAFGCCGLHALPRHGHGKRDRYTEGDN